MAVYFFDCFDGRTHHTDVFGAEMLDDVEAGEQADALVHALLGENLDRGSPDTAWVEVRSGGGRAVYSVRLTLSRTWAGSEERNG